MPLVWSTLLVAGVAPRGAQGDDASPYPADWPYTPVITPNGASLPWTVTDGVKEFRLVAEEIEQEFAPGMKVKCWGYNGRTPGPTIEVVQGDRIRVLVTNKLPEATTVHWHGVLLPSPVDGVQGLTQRGIPPGETYAYAFAIDQEPGTLMYHSHGDEMVQMGLGTMGFFIVHPRDPTAHRVDRDFAIFLHEWFIAPGTTRPDPIVMTEFNLFTFNGRVFPGTDPLIARTGQRVRIRYGNVGQDIHPIHLHGHTFQVTGTDGGPIPASARWPETTVTVAPGQTRDIGFVARAGDWALHCHKRHHPMNAMGHDVTNVLGVDQSGVDERIRKLLPGYMAMGRTGMDEHGAHAAHRKGPSNTLPMMGGTGPFGPIGMGGMFTILKVRDTLHTFTDREAGWYQPSSTPSGPSKPADPAPPAVPPPEHRHEHR